MEKTSLRKQLTKVLLNATTLKNTAGVLGSLCTVAYFVKTLNQAKNEQIKDNESVSFDDTLDIELKLPNTEPHYIDQQPLENLISLPRYQKALFCVKQANRVKSKENNKRVIDELISLHSEKNKNQLINDGYVDQISQLLNDELMFELALKAPDINNQFFRIEPPTTIQKINKIT